MKILLVSTSTSLGGAEECLFMLARELKENGHEIKVISFYPEGQIARKLKEKDITVVTCNAGRGATLTSYLCLKRELKNFKPDIVHAFLYQAIQVCRLAKNKNFRLVTAPHSDYRLLNWFRLFVDRCLAGRDDVSLAESESTKRFLIDGLKYDPEKVRLFVNTPESKFRENKTQRKAVREEMGAADKTVFITVARLNKGKGHDNLLNSFAKIYRDNKNAALWLIGDGPEMPALQAQAKELKIENGVTFLGERDNVEKYLNGADCFVLPSMSESRSLALLEARAAGLPAIASAVGDNSLIYAHGAQGFSYAAGDETLLTCFMSEMLKAEVRARFREEIKNGAKTVSDRLGDAYMGIVGQVFKEER